MKIRLLIRTRWLLVFTSLLRPLLHHSLPLWRWNLCLVIVRREIRILKYS